MHTDEGMSDGQTQEGEASRRGIWRPRREFICCFVKPRLVRLLLYARQSTRHWGDAAISKTRLGPAFVEFSVCWRRQLSSK